MYLFKPPEFGTDFVLLFIYIPLCIYLNRNLCVPMMAALRIFTFHYVSISTKRVNKPTAPPRIFTFHYVSISTSLS